MQSIQLETPTHAVAVLPVGKTTHPVHFVCVAGAKGLVMQLNPLMPTIRGGVDAWKMHAAAALADASPASRLATQPTVPPPIQPYQVVY